MDENCQKKVASEDENELEQSSLTVPEHIIDFTEKPDVMPCKNKNQIKLEANKIIDLAESDCSNASKPALLNKFTVLGHYLQNNNVLSWKEVTEWAIK